MSRASSLQIGVSSESERLTREQFDALTAPHEALAVGSPEQIADKILFQYALLGHRRYSLQLNIGGMPYPLVAKSIELFSTVVAPAVRKVLAAAEQRTF
ncbi:hypothetical protein ACFSR7_19195 [Cohnella sp. GCM10020058]|uniref:hypothetical protein n=1 Tax=Cohnella sp. GCM10020058 TaxID=3317330 RepID=UPI00362EC67A